MAVISRSIVPLPAGTALSRYMVGLKFGADYTRRFDETTPQVRRALSMDWEIKASVQGLSLGGAPTLLDLGVLDLASVQYWSGVSAFEAVRSRLRPANFGTPVPRQIDAGSAGDWVDEGAAIPALAFMFDTVSLMPTKAAAFYAASNDTLRSPQADAILGTAMLRAMGRLESDLFLNPTRSASGDAPASITNGAPEITAATVTATLNQMVAAISTSGADCVWLAHPLELAYVASQLQITDISRELLGLPTLPVVTCPRGLIVLLDAGEILAAATPLVVDRATNATLEMDDAPISASTGAPGTPTGPTGGTVSISMFQTDTTAFRAARTLTWVPRTGSVAYSWINVGTP